MAQGDGARPLRPALSTTSRPAAPRPAWTRLRATAGGLPETFWYLWAGSFVRRLEEAEAIAAFLAPLLGTQALDHLGQAALWGGVAVVGVASAVGLRQVSRAADRARALA